MNDGNQVLMSREVIVLGNMSSHVVLTHMTSTGLQKDFKGTFNNHWVVMDTMEMFLVLWTIHLPQKHF